MKGRVLVGAVIGVIIVALPLNKAPTTLTKDQIQIAELANKTSTNPSTSDLESEGFEIINHTPAKLGYAGITVYRMK
ncbi:MAG: hypothetical protein ACR2IS_20225 [Nitrososphaeraceae archaeon]